VVGPVASVASSRPGGGVQQAVGKRERGNSQLLRRDTPMQHSALTRSARALETRNRRRRADGGARAHLHSHQRGGAGGAGGPAAAHHRRGRADRPDLWVHVGAFDLVRVLSGGG